MKFDKMTTRQLDYVEGFIKKCVALGVDPEVAIKSAATPYDIPGMPWANNMSGSSSLETAPTFSQQLGRGWGNAMSSLGKRMAKPDVSGSVEGSGWDPRTWGRRLGRGMYNLSEEGRFLEGARNPTEQKSMFNIAGQQGAESGTRAVRQMSDLARRQKEYERTTGGLSGRQFVKGSPYALGQPKAQYGGKLQQYEPPKRVEPPKLPSKRTPGAPVAF